MPINGIGGCPKWRNGHPMMLTMLAERWSAFICIVGGLVLLFGASSLPVCCGPSTLAGRRAPALMCQHAILPLSLSAAGVNPEIRSGRRVSVQMHA